MAGQYIVMVSPQKRTKGLTVLNAGGFIYQQNGVWPSAYAACSQALVGAMAMCAATAWSDWVSGNSGQKCWSATLRWVYSGLWPYQNACYARADCSLQDVQFRYNIPAAPSGATLKYAYLTETLAYAGIGVSRLVNVAITPGSSYVHQGNYTPGIAIDSTGWQEPWWPMSGGTSCSVSSTYGDMNWTLTVGDLVVIYEYDEDPDYDEEVSEIDDDSAKLKAYNYCEEAWFEYDEVAHGYDNPHSTAHTTQRGWVEFDVTDLKPDTWYWYRFVMLCKGVRKVGKIYYFKTKKVNDWAAYIKTLPATEVWATGATIHGELDYRGDSDPYLYLGFQWGLNGDTLENEPIRWLYSGTYHTGRYPIQATISGLYPDRTYYYRATLHVGTPPFSQNNYFGETLSFGGPESLFGEGREFVTAKKVADDVSKLAVGRYYMTHEGILQYESRFHREES